MGFGLALVERRLRVEQIGELALLLRELLARGFETRGAVGVGQENIGHGVDVARLGAQPAEILASLGWRAVERGFERRAGGVAAGADGEQIVSCRRRPGARMPLDLAFDFGDRRA